MEAKMVISAMAIVAIMIQLMAMKGEAVIDCKQVNSNLATCIPFLTGGDASPSAACCAGVKNLLKLVPTTADRRAACECGKAAAARYPVKDGAASSLPQKCGVVINIPISKTTDCQQIN